MSETYRHPDPVVNDPPPTVELVDRRLAPPRAGPRPEAAVTLVEGRPLSLTGETDSLRRRRLLAAAVFLAATFGLLILWVFVSDNPGHAHRGGQPLFAPGGAARGCAALLAAAVAALLASGAPLTRKQLRVVEYVLFLGVTAAVDGLAVLRRPRPDAPRPRVPADPPGLHQGRRDPDDGADDDLRDAHPELAGGRRAGAGGDVRRSRSSRRSSSRCTPTSAPFVGRLGAAEEAGSNILFLAIGAALAIYGSFLLNGLRTELHEARKFGQYQLVRKLGRRGDGRGLPRRARSS